MKIKDLIEIEIQKLEQEALSEKKLEEAGPPPIHTVPDYRWQYMQNEPTQITPMSQQQATMQQSSPAASAPAAASQPPQSSAGPNYWALANQAQQQGTTVNQLVRQQNAQRQSPAQQTNSQGNWEIPFNPALVPAAPGSIQTLGPNAQLPTVNSQPAPAAAPRQRPVFSQPYSAAAQAAAPMSPADFQRFRMGMGTSDPNAMRQMARTVEPNSFYNRQPVGPNAGTNVGRTRQVAHKIPNMTMKSLVMEEILREDLFTVAVFSPENSLYDKFQIQANSFQEAISQAATQMGWDPNEAISTGGHMNNGWLVGIVDQQ